MHKVSAKIVADSINHFGTRITTIQINVPKFLLQELNTHRQFSRNYNSARAIPAKVMRKSATFTPDEWFSNQAGMTGGKELSGFKRLVASITWQLMTRSTLLGHSVLTWAGLHKQHTNRWLEPIVWAQGVITSTEWANFLHQRNHSDAQPEIRLLAEQIEHLLATNSANYLEVGDWHLPYIDIDDVERFGIDDLLKISAARCARVSYGFKADKNVELDLKRFDMLMSGEVKHWSPCEHQAQVPDTKGHMHSGNFLNWRQYRKILEHRHHNQN
jgi:hypothetical protein